MLKPKRQPQRAAERSASSFWSARPESTDSAACGWENPTPPKALFKKHFGISMRDYRAQNAQR